jgi:two-component system nitrogen regulation sensor histidine kinase NtrY
VFRLLDGRKGVREITETAMGSWEYVTAFRRLPDGDILAAQVPLQAGATAIGSSDVAELLGFAVLVGAALSLVLALLVGRTLTRPIHALQVASERVGAGNLGLRLPADRRDEFGAVFRAFNRMVGRLRRARRQLVRTTRRTQAIMEEAAVGMVALDPAGRVTLVNPRAEGLLGADVAVGEPLSVPTPLGQELKRWLGAFLASEDQEAIGELHVEAERFRVRARRLGQEGASGGAVVALENVTDELRTERVLAWGEMARQVAHEVKNPLTPIKLSIQHIRRAWDDGSPEFGKILERNADAMLAEIDRLATIAKTFSRFGAPQEPGSSPLEPVDAGRVVEEVMRLYGATEGGVAFEVEVQKGLPRVQARVSELKEALINLLENARAAMREGGRVAVRVIPGQLHGSVEIRVVDQGSGIPEDLMPKVFEPHFSTRTTGTGLGLAIVRRLVESWGGVVSLESTAGEGTTVTLIIPAWE